MHSWSHFNEASSIILIFWKWYAWRVIVLLTASSWSRKQSHNNMSLCLNFFHVPITVSSSLLPIFLCFKSIQPMFNDRQGLIYNPVRTIGVLSWPEFLSTARASRYFGYQMLLFCWPSLANTGQNRALPCSPFSRPGGSPTSWQINLKASCLFFTVSIV
jgi:hypothetical protein